MIIYNMATPKDLNIMEGIEKGIGKSYNYPISSMYGIDLETTEGSAMINTRSEKNFPLSDTVYDDFTFTVDAGTDVVTVNGLGGVYNYGQAVTLTTTGTLPAGLATSTTYYVTSISGNESFKLSTTLYNADAGIEIDITDTGTGTHTITATQMYGAEKFVVNPEASGSYYNYYTMDSEGQLWVQYGNIWVHLPGNDSNDGRGLVIWKNYLFAGGGGQVDVYGPLTAVGNTATWTKNWQNFAEAAFYYPSIASIDGKLYIGSGRYVASLSENTGQTFAPGNGATFTWNAQALDLPNNERVSTLEDFGTSLMIGTETYGGGDTHIYPWDRVSASYDLPIKTNESGVKLMIAFNNRLYFTCGTSGIFYVSDGLNVTEAFRVPKYPFGFTNPVNSALYFYTDSIMIHNNKLYFGVYNVTSSTGGTGIWSFDPKTGRLNYEYKASSGVATHQARVLGLISTSSLGFFAGFYDESKDISYRYFIDSINSNVYKLTGYGANFETQLLRVGTTRRKRTFKEIEITFAKELATGQGIKLYYRENLTDSYTLIDTVDFTTFGAISAKSLLPPNLFFEKVQFKVEITTASNTTSSPELTSILLI